MSKFYITFGFIHKDSKGNSLRNCYTIVEAENEAEAREKMFASPVGHQWSNLYRTAQEAGVINYKLNLVSFSQL